MTGTFRDALLVEDEQALGTTLLIALKELGLQAERVTTLAAARTRVRKQAPQLLLLDRGLPDGDGLSLCRELREEGFAGAILMLTAATALEARVEGLDAGADDYLPKPFAVEELLARIKALARRMPENRAVTPDSSAASALQPPRWLREPSRLRIQGPRGWVELTPLEYKLASFLMDAGGAIVTREDLLKNVWGFTLLPRTRTVDLFLSRLRKHFEENAERPRHFLTVRGAGYRFADGTEGTE